MDMLRITEKIAKRYRRRFGSKWFDGQNVRDHAYRKISRWTTIRRIEWKKDGKLETE